MQRQSGFTIIEVLLFLAISVALLLVALASITSSINTTRFGDAIRSTESFLQQQYNEVSTGRDVRQGSESCLDGVVDSAHSSTPGTTNCVILGRLIKFDVHTNSGQIASRYIIAKDTTATVTGANESEKIANLDPKVFDSAELNTDFTNPWTLPYADMNRADGSPVGAIAIIRSPITGHMLLYSFPYSFTATNLSTVEINQANLANEVKLCMKSDDFIGSRVGYIRILRGQGQDVIKADLTATGGTC
jgi:type II secretory pathway pseudopilin PulG